MNYFRFHAVMIAVLVAITPSYAGRPPVRDGSTKEKAIPLTQRGSKAVEEEMTWMMKLHRYTPWMAIRDSMGETVRRFKAGKDTRVPSRPWKYSIIEHRGNWFTYWSFGTPQGHKEIYFDTGASIKTSGERARQESTRAEYMARKIKSLTL